MKTNIHAVSLHMTSEFCVRSMETSSGAVIASALSKRGRVMNCISGLLITNTHPEVLISLVDSTKSTAHSLQKVHARKHGQYMYVCMYVYMCM
jgi:hypothetical protein